LPTASILYRILREDFFQSNGISSLNPANKSVPLLYHFLVLTEGWSPPRVSLRLARGSRGLAAPVPTAPTEPFNALTPTGAQVKDESTHAVPLTCLGVISWRCSANPPGEAIPATVHQCVVRPVSAPRHCATHSHTAGAPHPRKRTAEPSKGGRTPVPRSPRTTP
jgi:hypothetical protein